MNREERKILFEKLKGKSLLTLIPNDDWRKAFEFYNAMHADEKPLTQHCRVCYYKVIHFLGQSIKEETA